MNLTREKVLMIPKLRKLKLTDAEIGVKLGVSRGTVARWIKKLRDEGIHVHREGRGGRPPLKLK